MVLTLPWERENLSNIWTWPHIFLLNLGGWWAEEASSPRLRYFLSIWRVITSTSVIITTTSLLAFSIEQLITGDLSEALVCVFVFSTLFQAIINMCFIMKYRKPLKHAMNLLDELTRNIHHPKDITIIKKKMVRIWIIFLAGFLTGVLGSLHWIIRPIIYAIFYDDRTLIIYDNWPLFLNSRTLFILSYFFETFNSLLLSVLFVLFNSIFICISEYILCHFKVLQNKLERLHLNTGHLDVLNFKDIVKCHTDILQISENLRFSSEEVIIIQTVVAVATYCLILFTITTDDNISITLIVNLLEVFTSVTVNFGLLCWYSSQVTLKCEDFRNMAYMSDWISGETSEKKTLLILIRRTMLPIKFGGFIQLSLNTMISVLKATFSYYNFLIAVLENQ